MRLRRPTPSKRTSPILLLFLTSLLAHSTIASPADNAKPGSVEHLAKDPVGASLKDAEPPAPPPRNPDVGTKDAPVDGMDGKPHAGPFVDTAKKPALKVEDLTVPVGAKGEEGAGKAKEKGATEGGAASSPSASSKEKEKEKDGKSKDKMEGWAVPERESESVMEDRGKKTKGPKGTEGGVSEKDRDRKAKEESSGGKKQNVPIPVTEKGDVPGGEEVIAGKETAKKEEEKEKGSFGLEKPSDLPSTPHGEHANPVPGGVHKTDPKAKDPPVKSPSSGRPSPGDTEPGAVINPFRAFILSLTMIIFSEIGDKTFLVAALMAMRHPRLVVFSAAFSALIAMTILSAVLGHAVPTLLPVRLTHFAAAILFLFFGAKLLKEGLAMSPDEGVGEEMREVEQELEEKESSLARRSSRHGNGTVSAYALEAGRGRRARSDSRLPAPARSPSTSPSPTRSPSPSSRKSIAGALQGLNNLLSLLLSPAWVQTFVMTFLGEWGDRSQIATIAMAAGQDYWWITGGAVVGHGLCTAVAVIGGRAIAGRVSMRIVTLGGAGAFVVFGIIYLAEAAYSSS